MLKRSAAVFDELRQSVKDAVSADPTTGELKIYPRINHRRSFRGSSSAFLRDFAGGRMCRRAARHGESRLRTENRSCFLRQPPPQPDAPTSGDLPSNISSMIQSSPQDCIAVGRAAGHSILRNDQRALIFHPPAHGITIAWRRPVEPKALMPTARFTGFSMHLSNHFVANGPFLATYPKSAALFCSLKVLPVKLPARPWLITIATLKNRTLSPVVERFIECAREVGKALAKGHQQKGPSR
jgi:DNA-binding transcriptional LysR family regulator